MKKLFFTLLLAAATLPGWAEDLYLVGNAVSIGWNIKNAMRATKMTETGSSTNVYEWTGYFKASGQFKILTNKDSWDYGYNATSSLVTLSEPSSIQDRNGGDNQWKVASDGIYKITVNTSEKTIKAESATMTIPTLTDGYYQIGTANDLKNFADAINKGAIAPSVKAKLTADIDMTSITDFTPICCANAIKFTGEFDGQGYAITNLKVDYGTFFGYTGLFCYATDGAVIKNLIVGTGCSFKGTAKIGGIIGSAEGGGTVTLTNVINMANVTSTGNSSANAAGLVGCGQGGTKIVATNCANTGEIHGQDGECAAFAGWTQSGTSFTNCWNIGDIYNMDNNQSLYRKPGDATITLSNCYDANGEDFYTQGTKIARTTVASGELCYKLNDNTSGGTNWYQTLTSDDFPFPFSTHGTLYKYGTDPSYWFSNLVISGSPLTATISSANDLMEFSRIVNNGNSVNAELTTDIDMDGITDYTPIGVDAHRFSSTFDGKGFRIKNLKIETDTKEQGLFSVCAGGATIKNLIIDSSCSITCNNSSNHGAAAFVAVCNGSGTLTFENCGNEADVYGAKSNNGAFLGFNHSNGNVSISLTNCYNTGKISGGYDNCAIIGWNGDNTFTMTNCYNIGTVENYNGDKNTWARSGGTKNVNNCYSKNVTGTDYDFDDNLTMINDAQKTSGELCYNLGSVFRQALGAGGDAYPVLDSSKPNVYKMTVGSAGWASFVPEVNIATLPTDVTAYVGQNNGNSLHLKAVTALPADNAFIVKATGGDYYYNNTNESVTLSEENDLDFYAADHTADGSQYCLSNKASGVGFYKVGVDVTIPARKAYLTITTTGAKEFYGFDDDDATGISLMEDGRSQMEDGAIYNLAGQRINKMQRGINIVNGKKVLK